VEFTTHRIEFGATKRTNSWKTTPMTVSALVAHLRTGTIGRDQGLKLTSKLSRVHFLESMPFLAALVSDHLLSGVG
jgi:hypothetical protein